LLEERVYGKLEVALKHEPEDQVEEDYLWHRRVHSVDPKGR
jgi:hypothetical protein